MRSDVKIIKGLKDWSPDAAGLIPRGVVAARKMDGAVPEEMGLYTDEKATIIQVVPWAWGGCAMTMAK